MSANPYELKGRARGGPARPARAAPLTEEEQIAKLVGYVSVARAFWPNVKYATHVRYVETAARGGEFRGGGFVLNNPFDTQPRGSAVEKRFIKLKNGFNKKARNYAEWIVAYEDIELLFAKGTGVEMTLQRDLQTAVTTLSGNLQRMATYCKKLELRVAGLEGRGLR
jgi:hypothetical protein